MTLVRVRFKRAKRYPHPTGPRRHAGTTHPILASFARQWADAGLVEILDEPTEVETAASVEDRVRDLITGTPVPKLREALEGEPDDIVELAAGMDERSTAARAYAKILEDRAIARALENAGEDG